MTSENRATPRVNAPLVMVKISTRERMKTGYLKDLSEGGLFVRADKPLPVGREVIVDLLPPGWSTPLRLSGSVVRVSTEPPGMGLKLDDDDAEKTDALRALLKEYEAEMSAGTPNYQQQLMHLLDQYADLQNTLQQREAELTQERDRREESGRRALELSAELEIVKLRGSSDSSVSPKQSALEAELEATRQEVITHRLRLSELEGALKGTTEELLQLESDEAASRKLASNLAREKAELSQEFSTHSKANAALTEQLEQLRADFDRKADELHRVKAERDALSTSLHELRLKSEQMNERSATSSAKATELLDINRSLNERLTEATSQLSSMKTKTHALETRVTQLENGATEAAAKLEKAKAREREVRDLLAMVAKGDEEVVVSEPAPEPVKVEPLKAEAPKPMPLTQVVETKPAEPSPSEPDPWVLPAPSSASTIEVDVDEVELPAPKHPAETKIRSNGRLSLTGSVKNDTSALAKDVASRLATHDRFSDLMVELRGHATPVQLIGALTELIDAGVASVE